MRIEDWNVLKLVVFRENMNSNLTLAKAREIFGDRVVDSLDPNIKRLLGKDVKSNIVNEKVSYFAENIERLFIYDWVKYIAITGSVAAQTAKESDDIDLFVVVKNDTGWLYRGLVLVKNLFSGKVRSAHGEDVKDKFCVNMIVEERGLEFAPDMFNFHELHYMISVFNPNFARTIVSRNEWVRTFGSVSEGSDLEVLDKKIPWIIRFLNRVAMIGQILYMVLLFHRPDVGKILRNYKDGKIMFHPKGFKEERVIDYERRYEERLRELMGK